MEIWIETKHCLFLCTGIRDSYGDFCLLTGGREIPFSVGPRIRAEVMQRFRNTVKDGRSYTYLNLSDLI